MTSNWPEYLNIPQSQLGEGLPVRVDVVADQAAVARQMAECMLAEIRSALESRRRAVVIIPVGPVDQYPLLARLINQERLSLQHVLLINMDEYLTDAGDWIDAAHPLSFRGYMQRAFYELIAPELQPPVEQRVFPDPRQLEAISRWIADWGGVDTCFGGIGINGHIAFNEPPEP
ncbi:MAG: glucosamine-6-phosphate isomerase, partial [Planctomycetaceae bacterium]|nr:glucosamine-6-phosphate isomerase [Planctomycetaceae bacterium]